MQHGHIARLPSYLVNTRQVRNLKPGDIGYILPTDMIVLEPDLEVYLYGDALTTDQYDPYMIKVECRPSGDFCVLRNGSNHLWIPHNPSSVPQDQLIPVTEFIDEKQDALNTERERVDNVSGNGFRGRAEDIFNW